MFEESVLSFLKNRSKNIKRNVFLHVFGVAEPIVEEMIKSVMKEIEFSGLGSMEFSIFADESVVDIKFSVFASNEVFVNKAINDLKLKFAYVLKDNIFVFDKDTIESLVGRLLLENKKTISFAESCSGGMIAAAVTNVSGSSSYFKCSVVAYSNNLKMKLLNVKEKTLADHGAVSGEIAKEMVEGVLRLSGSDYAFSTTGIAGPHGNTKEKPVGLVYVGFADKNKTENFKFNFNGTRTEIRKKTVNTVLNLIARRLIAKR
ncbi:MAG: hypothetical protein Nk1A_1960 [Endomicrobiia bacterium]|nr:MAG: hypothetical protein Nk1A_1960 [Endomicrobiia bacterium]